MHRWQRKEMVTRCADPTVVVTWINKDLGIEIEEFQQVYRTTYDGVCAELGTPIDILGAQLHKALEHGYHEENEQRFMMEGRF